MDTDFTLPCCLCSSPAVRPYFVCRFHYDLIVSKQFMTEGLQIEPKPEMQTEHGGIPANRLVGTIWPREQQLPLSMR